MQIPKDIASPVNKALYRLSMGDLTRGEMLAYLTDPKRKNTGFDEETSRRVVDFLSDNGYLDDKRYLRLLVSKLDRSFVGPRKIRERLIRHRFPPSYVEAALSRNVDYRLRAVKLLMKTARGEERSKTPEGRKKLMDHLVRQGYDYTTAREAVNEFSRSDDWE